MCHLSNVTMMIRSRSLRWEGHVACMGEDFLVVTMRITVLLYYRIFWYTQTDIHQQTEDRRTCQ